jgi:hypothetical protein
MADPAGMAAKKATVAASVTASAVADTTVDTNISNTVVSVKECMVSTETVNALSSRRKGKAIVMEMGTEK